MSAEFSPYRELLGIDSAERPDHYVLLGVPRFESDASVIDDAAGERMSLLQEFANSEHLDASQKLLNEVSAARRCLLDATSKIAYDEELRIRDRRATASGSAGRSSKGGRKSGPPMMPLGVAVGVVAVLLVLFFVFKGGPAPTGNLIVNWPVDERQGAAVLMDGENLQISEANPIYFQIPQGRHRIVFQRNGFRDITKTQTFSKMKINMTLAWSPKK